MRGEINLRPLACAFASALFLTACGASATSPRSSPRASNSASSTAPTHRVPSHRPSRPRHHGRPPGDLPQTNQRPSSRSSVFAHAMHSLWSAIVTDRPQLARRAFFPVAAYVRVKAIGSPAADWRDRLFADFRLDVEAAHAVLGAGAPRARLVRIQVPSAYVHWIPPGVCANAVGYYEVPNARVVYRVGGQERSFGIASMISWRGQWYVVHLGYVGRVSIGGRVDDPTAGPGVSAPSSTC